MTLTEQSLLAQSIYCQRKCYLCLICGCNVKNGFIELPYIFVDSSGIFVFFQLLLGHQTFRGHSTSVPHQDGIHQQS